MAALPCLAPVRTGRSIGVKGLQADVRRDGCFFRLWPYPVTRPLLPAPDAEVEISASGSFEKGDKQMARKRFSVEQIINHLREAEVLLAQGKTVGEICRHIGVSGRSYYRWRREYGGLKVDQARRLKERAGEHSNHRGGTTHGLDSGELELSRHLRTIGSANRRLIEENKTPPCLIA